MAHRCLFVPPHYSPTSPGFMLARALEPATSAQRSAVVSEQIRRSRLALGPVPRSSPPSATAAPSPRRGSPSRQPGSPAGGL